MNKTNSESLAKAALPYFREHEGVVPHMYLDIVGLVTVGIGRMLPTAASAASLRFFVRGTNRDATYPEKTAEWDRIKALPAAHVHRWYLPYATLEMAPEDIEAEFYKSCAGFIAGLSQRFPAMDTYPRPVQIGLLDMAYSLGVAGVVGKYPKFCAAVDRRDWSGCANECARRNVSDNRNIALAALFLSALEDL